MRGTAVLRSAMVIGALTITALTITAMASMPPASATDNWGLNGTYTATSNGEWAKTNDVFHNERSVRTTWTVSTVCSYPTECSGTVNSDGGWSAPIYQKSGVWYVKRIVPNWMPCPDGTTADGSQLFRFLAATPDGGSADATSNTLVGEDQTTGQAGGCGVNLPLFITMPFKLVKQG